MDKVIYALHTKLLSLNHRQSFAKTVVKVRTVCAIYLIHIAIGATKVAGARIVELELLRSRYERKFIFDISRNDL